VAHNKWIPELSHNEAFRQWALLKIKDKLNDKLDANQWKMSHKHIALDNFNFNHQAIQKAHKNKEHIVAVNLPGFKGILSHFTQPGKIFANEIEDRLKVIACLERPNMTHSEELEPFIDPEEWKNIKKKLGASEEDAQIIFWSPDEDLKTALETIEERCQMAFEGVPRETRKTFKNGTTVFERVLPGPDRMYPDTDSAPIPLEKKYIEKKRKNLPTEIIHQYEQMKKWDIPEDTYYYIFRNNLFPLIQRIVEDLKINPKFVGTLLGHRLKFIEGHYKMGDGFEYEKIYELFKFIQKSELEPRIAKKMLPYIYQNPEVNKEEVLDVIGYEKSSFDKLMARIPELSKEYEEIRFSANNSIDRKVNWIMGQLHNQALGNGSLKDLRKSIEKKVTEIN
jgi:glutamyl-tRNA(Gln) amidotransferase subunit E